MDRPEQKNKKDLKEKTFMKEEKCGTDGHAARMTSSSIINVIGWRNTGIKVWWELRIDLSKKGSNTWPKVVNTYTFIAKSTNVSEWTVGLDCYPETLMWNIFIHGCVHHLFYGQRDPTYRVTRICVTRQTSEATHWSNKGKKIFVDLLVLRPLGCD